MGLWLERSRKGIGFYWTTPTFVVRRFWIDSILCANPQVYSSSTSEASWMGKHRLLFHIRTFEWLCVLILNSGSFPGQCAIVELKYLFPLREARRTCVAFKISTFFRPHRLV